MAKANLKFDAAILKELIDHAKASTEWSMGYSSNTPPAPALFLVGDEGVYLMSNGKPGLPKDEEAAAKQADGEEFFSCKVAYAKGFDPEKDDDYYENKRRIFGGDDGAETLMVTDFEPLEGFVGLNITPNSISIIRRN